MATPAAQAGLDDALANRPCDPPFIDPSERDEYIKAYYFRIGFHKGLEHERTEQRKRDEIARPGRDRETALKDEISSLRRDIETDRAERKKNWDEIWIFIGQWILFGATWFFWGFNWACGVAVVCMVLIQWHKGAENRAWKRRQRIERRNRIKADRNRRRQQRRADTADFLGWLFNLPGWRRDEEQRKKERMAK